MTDEMQAAWDRGWRIGAKPLDAARHLLCLLIGHDWQVNHRDTQRACLRCWWCQDRRTPPTQPPAPTTPTDAAGGERGGL